MTKTSIVPEPRRQMTVYSLFLLPSSSRSSQHNQFLPPFPPYFSNLPWFLRSSIDHFTAHARSPVPLCVTYSSWCAFAASNRFCTFSDSLFQSARSAIVTPTMEPYMSDMVRPYQSPCSPMFCRNASQSPNGIPVQHVSRIIAVPRPAWITHRVYSMH